MYVLSKRDKSESFRFVKKTCYLEVAVNSRILAKRILERYMCVLLDSFIRKRTRHNGLQLLTDGTVIKILTALTGGKRWGQIRKG